MARKEKLIEKAQKYIQKGNFEKAISEYKSAFKLDPKDISIRLRLGDLYVKTDRRKDAVTEYMEVAKDNSKKGFYLKAIAVYKQILKLDASNFDVHYKLAELYTKQRLNADAISEYSYIVSTLERAGKTNDAIGLVKKMLDIDPENTGIRLRLAEMYQKVGFTQDAIDEYSQIFERLSREGKLDRAEKIFTELNRTYPGNLDVLERLTELYKKKNNYEAFRNYSNELLDQCRIKGDTERARLACESILEVTPGDEDVRTYMENLGGPYTPETNSDNEAPAVADFSYDDSSPTFAAAEETVAEDHGEAEIEISLDGFEESSGEAHFETGNSSGTGETEEDVLVGVDAPVIDEENESLEAAAVESPAEGSRNIEELRFKVNEEVIDESAINAGTTGDLESDLTDALDSVNEAENVVLPEEIVEEATEDIEIEALDQPAAFEEASYPEEDLAEAVEELMEKIEPEEHLLEQYPGSVEAEVVGAEDAKTNEYVDLSTELGMEEALETLTESWGEGESAESLDEFRNGLGKQLSREDTETHYNLGIAYMEMELFSEASNEFKIALKDPHLEFDCYNRLGLCAMETGNPEESINYYQKGLKVEGRTDDERKGLMYELALALEAAQMTDKAAELFLAIHAKDPSYREVAEKVSLYKELRPDIPLDDGIIEVELL